MRRVRGYFNFSRVWRGWDCLLSEKHLPLARKGSILIRLLPGRNTSHSRIHICLLGATREGQRTASIKRRGADREGAE